MAIGDLVDAYGAYEYNGFKFGHATNFIVTKFAGLYDKGTIKTTDYDRSDSWGEYPGRDMYKGKMLTVTIDIVNETGTIDQDVDLLRAALAVPDTIAVAPPVPLVFWRNWAYAGKRYIMCRPGQMSMPSDGDLAMGHGVAMCQLKANDPRIYSLITTTVSIPATVTNNGDSAAAPILTVVGPTSGNVVVQNVSDANRGFIMDLTLVGGQTLVVNFAKRTIQLNGINVYGYRNALSKWWKLQPGANVIGYSSGGTASLTYSDTWS